jgi:hypothetical protein
LKTEFLAEPFTKNLEGDSYSINSATIFSKFPEMGERSKGQKIADFHFELVMCPLFCLAEHA